MGTDETIARRAALKEVVIATHLLATTYSMRHDLSGRPLEAGQLAAHQAMAAQLRGLADKMDGIASRGTPSVLAAFFGAPG